MECFRWLYVSWRNHGHLGPRMPQNHGKTKKSTHFSCPLSSFYLDPLHGHGSIFFVQFFEVFATLSVQQCQLLIFCFFFGLLVLGFWEKISLYTLIDIGTVFTPPHFKSMFSLTYWFWLLGHQRKHTGKTTLWPTSSGTPLDWCFFGMRRFWFLVFKGLVPVLQIWRNLEKKEKTDFTKNYVFKQHFVV